ncbi:uncharacterized protein HKW66_Vig0150170 [Vigna angularis]|uniref:Uncharacterized protein n=1 Tax=Phaseolus angularis TaxID=3914 RepID=A0A8T0JX81_PHAAN|nr:uncharacterized protein HKW66_Vig0150170 [Vigna angularis]
MAGLLAWAVGGGAGKEAEDDSIIPILFSEDQQRYVIELDQKAASLRRLIHDLRLRLPPQDISQSLPHLHAHSLASNAALALQLNSHSATRQQAQLREVTLKEENAAYENAISDFENKIKEKLQEADLLRTKLQEMDETEKKLKAELDNIKQQASDEEEAVEFDGGCCETVGEEMGKTIVVYSLLSKSYIKYYKLISFLRLKLHNIIMIGACIFLALKRSCSAAQREKTLDKQLHGLIEQLAAKQAQAEGLLGDIHLKEMELERLNGLWRQTENSNLEANTAARYRFSKSSSDKLHSMSDYEGHQRLPYHSAGRSETQQRLMLFRSAFVLYILALHILVFIRISF